MPNVAILTGKNIGKNRLTKASKCGYTPLSVVIWPVLAS